MLNKIESDKHPTFIPIELGETYSPFSHITNADIDQVQIKNNDYYLKGIGRIYMQLDRQFSNIYHQFEIVRAVTTHEGTIKVVQIPTDLYELKISVNFDTQETAIGNIQCIIEAAGGFKMTGENMEKENPQLAGYAAFDWKKPSDPQDGKLLFPLHYVQYLNFRFETNEH